MKNKNLYIAFIILVIAIVYSHLKISYYSQKNTISDKNIIRYGKDIKEGDILNINGNKEIVIKILKDGSYITKIIN